MKPLKVSLNNIFTNRYDCNLNFIINKVLLSTVGADFRLTVVQNISVFVLTIRNVTYLYSSGLHIYLIQYLYLDRSESPI